MRPSQGGWEGRPGEDRAPRAYMKSSQLLRQITPELLAVSVQSNCENEMQPDMVSVATNICNAVYQIPCVSYIHKMSLPPARYLAVR